MLVSIRREVCPGARWRRQGRHWLMNEPKLKHSFVPPRLGWTSRGRRLRYESMTSPGFSDLCVEHHILWGPQKPISGSAPAWSHSSSRWVGEE